MLQDFSSCLILVLQLLVQYVRRRHVIIGLGYQTTKTFLGLLQEVWRSCRPQESGVASCSIRLSAFFCFSHCKQRVVNTVFGSSRWVNTITFVQQECHSSCPTKNVPRGKVATLGGDHNSAAEFVRCTEGVETLDICPWIKCFTPPLFIVYTLYYPHLPSGLYS